MNRNNQSKFIKEQFIQAIKTQPPKRKEVLLEFRRYSQKKVAEKLHIEQNTVSKHISDFWKKSKLKCIFEGYDKDEFPNLLKKLLNAYISNIIADEIRESISLIRDINDLPDRPENKRGKIIIIIETDAAKVNRNLLDKYLKAIKEKGRDESMKIEQIEDGSIKVNISGTLEGCQRLKDLFDSGELTEIAGSQVIDVSTVEVVTEDSLWTNIRTWLESNILPEWNMEEIVGGTISALRTNPDFFANPAMRLRDGADSVSISELLESLNSEDIDIVRLAAQKLGEIEANTPEVINGLKDKINTIEDVQTQWQIALSLGIIAPEEHPQAKAQKQTIELGDTSLELIVATKNDEDDFVCILAEIRPDLDESWDEYLPIGLEAKILEESGEEFWLDDIDFTRQVNDQQSYIYFSFWGTPGDRFILQLSLNNVMLRKNFQI